MTTTATINDPAQATANPVMTHNGTLTVKSEGSGEHRTFRIRTQKADADFAPGERIISLLTGPDNTASYTQFGFVKVEPERRAFRDDTYGACPQTTFVRPARVKVIVWRKYRGRPGSPLTQYEKLARMIERLANHIDEGRVTINLEGRCRRCNKPLTTPQSVHEGIGPVCAGRED